MSDFSFKLCLAKGVKGYNMDLIYCVEDDEDIRDLIVYAIKSGGFEAEGFCNAEEFYSAIKTRMPDLVILDIMLPDKSGTRVLKELREQKPTEEIPVIFLTAKGSEADKVKGFELGADDYVTKPFGVMELLSRIKAVLKRYKKEDKSCIEYKGISVNTNSRSVSVDGKDVVLTYKEYELLCVLIKNIGIAVARETLLNDVWGYDFAGESRTLDVHIGSLRHKLGERGSCIETVRNVGYRIS